MVDIEAESKRKNSQQRITIDDAVNTIGSRINLPVFLLGVCTLSCSMAGSACTYMLKFTGIFLDWECSSKRCDEIELHWNATQHSFYDVKTICDNNLKYGKDYIWNSSRTTLLSDFGTVCREADMSLLNSLYFVGGTVGLVVGSFAYELFGRRRTSIMGGIFLVFGTFLGFFCRSYSLMAVIRVLQGLGWFLCYTGIYIWCLELVAENMRVYFKFVTAMLWAAGYVLIVGISYFIHNWHYIHVAAASVFLMNCLPLFFLPDSPRYLLSIGKFEESRKVLESYGRLAGVPMDWNLVDLSPPLSANSEETELIDNKKCGALAVFRHKDMLLETFVLAYLWFSTCLLFYGLNFGWGSFGDTPYVNYLFAALGEATADFLLIPVVKFPGRALAMRTTAVISILCFLLAMIDWKWTAVWSLDRLMALIAIVSISVTFSVIYIWSAELAPTSHRGLILSVGSLSARAAAFIGPFVSSFSNNRRVILGINAFLAGSAGLMTLLLPETTKIPLAETPDQVTVRRKDQGFKSLQST